MPKKSNKGFDYEDKIIKKLCFINSCILYYFFASKNIISCKKKGPRNIGPFNLIKCLDYINPTSL